MPQILSILLLAAATPDQYPAKASSPALTVGAEVMNPGQVKNEFSTTLAPTYQVLEVAVYPAKGSTGI